MTDMAALEARYRVLRDLASRGRMSAQDVEACVSFALDANDAGRADWSIALLEAARTHSPRAVRVHQVLALAYRDEQRMAEAADSFAVAASLAPKDLRIVAGQAQTMLESGRPAAALFRDALKLAPGHAELTRSAAAALVSEGRADVAERMLADMLARQPDWIAGHEDLSLLRWMQGDRDGFWRQMEVAIGQRPNDLSLRLALFRALSGAGLTERARAVLADARSVLGDAAALDAAEAVWAAENGQPERAGQLLSQLPPDALMLTRLRHALRGQRLDEAERLASQMLETKERAAAWPYLSTIWRLKGDARAVWLDGDPPFIGIYDLELESLVLAELAALLRGLHRAKAHFPLQSVRGGTQTEQPLFFRSEAPIRQVKAAILAAVRSYIDALPPPVPGHPLLGTPRGKLLFEGSWSVRLRPGGFHVTHSHPHGWISSACYIDIPDEAARGPAPAGWLELGAPPPELGLPVEPYRRIEPRAGRLVLFPSTMWHGTVPFDNGERLSIACDIRVPRY